MEVKTGVYEILDYIKMTGIRCAVATSTSRVLTEERLRKLHLIQYFDYICCGDEVKHTKPSPDVYLNVIDTMNVCKDNALVFEDSAVGVQAAWSAGIPIVMVPDLVQATEIQQRQTVKIISSLHEGIPLLDEIQKDGMKYERCI